MKQSTQRARAAGSAAFRWFLLIAAYALCAAAGAQRIASLSQAKTLCIESFDGGADAAHLRDSLVRELSRSGRFRLVQSPAAADAIVKGTGQIWVRGYVSINPRTPSSDREAVYGGYLSLEVVAASGQPLWSWLATPARFSWSNIFDNLAGHAAKKLIEAGEPAAALPSVPFTGGTLRQTSLTAAGATFPAPLYQKWFEDFSQLHPGASIRYSAIGSQLGLETLAAGKLDFAGSDVAPDVVLGAAAASHMLRIASVLGGVVLIYNLKDVGQDLRFTPETLAGIYLGRIRRWNDPEIRRSNPGVHLPDAPIAVFHRSDGSGTSWVWSNFLSKVSPAWSSAVGRGTTLQWPVGTGAEHNEGVAEAVAKTPNSIGYVELTYAIQHQLSYAAVRNRSGEYIHADLDSLAEAAREASAAGEPPSDISDPPGKFAYPIASFTWLVFPPQSASPAKRAALLSLFRWVLTDGQKECAALGYAPLPREITDRQLRTLDSLP